jgi:xanthine dehydrogenase accessory factor
MVNCLATMHAKTLREGARSVSLGLMWGMIEALPDWPFFGLADDQRHALESMQSVGEPAVLATIVALDGGGPRPVGAQMVFGPGYVSGFLSGGCVEGDVMLHAVKCFADGQTRRLVYGEGSPWPDIRLLCGARIEIELQRFAPDDPQIEAVIRAKKRRQPASLTLAGGMIVTYDPVWRLAVIGGDPTAMATATLGSMMDFETYLIRPRGPVDCPLNVGYSRAEPKEALGLLGLDAWTAVAICGHDMGIDHEALLTALPSDAPYVGLLGARRRLGERLDRLRADGITEGQLQRLRAPIGLDLGGKAPWEIATAVLGEIVAVRHAAVTPGRALAPVP